MPNVSSLHKACDLAPDQRRAIESLLGRVLNEDEMVSVRTSTGRILKEALKGDAREDAFRKLFDRIENTANRAEGVSEEQIDAAIDEAVDYVRHNHG
jgi:hypothetical protein